MGFNWWGFLGVWDFPIFYRFEEEWLPIVLNLNSIVISHQGTPTLINCVKQVMGPDDIALWKPSVQTINFMIFLNVSNSLNLTATSVNCDKVMRNWRPGKLSIELYLGYLNWKHVYLNEKQGKNEKPINTPLYKHQARKHGLNIKSKTKRRKTKSVRVKERGVGCSTCHENRPGIYIIMKVNKNYYVW